MNEIMTAAFLILIGSQEPCPPPGSGGVVVYVPQTWLESVVGWPKPMIPVKDRAALDEAFAAAWLGDRCSKENEATVRVLDVKAGKWLAFKQARVTIKRQIEEPTGEYRTTQELKP